MRNTGTISPRGSQCVMTWPVEDPAPYPPVEPEDWPGYGRIFLTISASIEGIVRSVLPSAASASGEPGSVGPECPLPPRPPFCPLPLTEAVSSSVTGRPSALSASAEERESAVKIESLPVSGCVLFRVPFGAFCPEDAAAGFPKKEAIESLDVSGVLPSFVGEPTLADGALASESPFAPGSTIGRVSWAA